MGITLTIPIRTKTPGNNRQHWTKDRDAIKNQRYRVWVAMSQRQSYIPCMPVVIKLHRIGKRRLDGFGNLPSSFKAVVDELCKWYGVDDKFVNVDGRITIPECTQEVGKEYAVRITIDGAK